MKLFSASFRALFQNKSRLRGAYHSKTFYTFLKKVTKSWLKNQKVAVKSKDSRRKWVTKLQKSDIIWYTFFWVIYHPVGSSQPGLSLPLYLNDTVNVSVEYDIFYSDLYKNIYKWYITDSCYMYLFLDQQMLWKWYVNFIYVFYTTSMIWKNECVV